MKGTYKNLHKIKNIRQTRKGLILNRFPRKSEQVGQGRFSEYNFISFELFFLSHSKEWKINFRKTVYGKWTWPGADVNHTFFVAFFNDVFVSK